MFVQDAAKLLWHICSPASINRGSEYSLRKELGQTLRWSTRSGVLPLQEPWGWRKSWGLFLKNIMIFYNHLITAPNTLECCSRLTVWNFCSFSTQKRVVYIYRDRAGSAHIRCGPEPTRLAVGGRDGGKWASGVHRERGGLGEGERWRGWSSLGHGSC